MKFAFLPKPWDAVVDDLTDHGHTFVDLDESPDVLVFRGNPEDFPEELPPSVKLVQVAYAGVEKLVEAGVLDVDVPVANAAGIYDDTVAEAALALLLGVLHRHKAVTPQWNDRQLNGETDYLFDNKKVAVIGAGGIGKMLIRFLEPFGPEIIAVNRSGNPVPGAKRTVAMSEAQDVWSEADYFVLIAPLTKQTHHLVNAEVLRAMKPNAVVVNVGRGPLIDTEALTKALQDGTIAGAGLDVTDPEPLPEDHPLWQMDRCLITPHTANIPRYMQARVGELTRRNWEALQEGRPMPTQIDVEEGY